MRGLIRLDLAPKTRVNQLWTNRQDYDDAVIRLFREIGYIPKDPRSNGDSNVPPVAFSSDSTERQQQLQSSAEIATLFEDVPADITAEEQRHMIMLGYTSEGQSTFVVCAINPTELHIRIRQGLFERLRRSCLEIARKVRRHDHLFNRFFHRQELRVTTRDTIEVMEAHRDIPTIRGEIVHSSTAELVRRHWPELVIALVTFVISSLLFLNTPRIASPTQSWLAARGFTFTLEYVRGTFERVYSAFLVTFFITTLTLLIQWIAIYRRKPITWNSGIEPRSDSRR